MGLEDGHDDVLAHELDGTPEIMREYGEHLERVARTLPARALLSAAVRPYERLVERVVAAGGREAYARAGACCRVIFSFEGMDELDPVNGAGTATIEGDQLIFKLMYHQGDDYSFACKRR